jgi:hypothetical protein
MKNRQNEIEHRKQNVRRSEKVKKKLKLMKEERQIRLP